MKATKFALVTALALGGSSVLFTSIAEAQREPRRRQEQRQREDAERNQAPQLQGERRFNVSAEEQAAITPLYQAIQNQDWAAAQAALPAAKAAAQGADAMYVVGQAQLRIGTQLQNPQLQAEGIDAMLASGAGRPQDMGPLLTNQAALAISAGNLEKAEAALTRLAELNPNDPQAVINLAEIKNDRNNKAEAMQLYQRALQLQEASGQPVPEHWYRRALAVAYDARMLQPSLDISRQLVAAYPNQVNWRDALLVYRDLAQVSDGQFNIDTLRLMRAADALNGERDYVELAEDLSQAGLPGESKAVLELGISKNMLEAGDSRVRELMTLADRRIAEDRASLTRARTQAEAAADGRQARSAADAYFGYGEFVTAAELYRQALQKGGVDADLVNTRLGMALALAGQRADAEQAFRAVGGARQALANYWLVWLAQRQG